MGTDKLYRAEGIVIRRRDQGEADRVLTLCTPLGKIQAIAKGARKMRSRKAGHIELFSRSQFIISQVRNSWDVISQAETIEPHEGLRADLHRGAYARYAVELMDGFFTQEEGGQTLLDLLDHTLARLERDEDLDLVIRFYEQHLLGLAGFRPEVNGCVGDHERPVPLRPRELDEEQKKRRYGFDPERGGALCQACFAHPDPRYEQRVMGLSPAGLWFLQACQRQPYAKLRAYDISPALHAEAERVMHRYVTYHLERDVRAATFLRQLNHVGGEGE